jgi:transcriptional regulator with XRE-family HTH domain
VAELAGISTAWYTWLEQGRDVNPSREVLDSIATVLRLDAVERSHLAQLAGSSCIPYPSSEPDPALLNRLLQGYRWAAYVIGRRWDLLAWNEAACETFIDFAATPERERNLLRCMFLDPRMKRLFVDWERSARRMLAEFRPNVARYARDGDFDELVASLRHASREFDAWWVDHDVRSPVSGVEVLRQRGAGQALMEYATFQPYDLPGARLVMYAPAISAPVTDAQRRRGAKPAPAA